MTVPISHAFVLPDENFQSWLDALRPYTQKFERVAIVRSPRGNDLNRYRNVTTVRAPLTWQNDDPLAHIRRIYPMVVRVDVVNARTPQEMSAALQTRIANNDRYGTKSSSAHISDRFILDYPIAHSVAGIVSPFEEIPSPTAQLGVTLRSVAGARVLAGASGRVARVVTNPDALKIGAYVQITTTHAGKTYTVTYGNLRDIKVKLNDNITVGAELANATGDSVTLILQEAGGGVAGYALPNIVDPARALYVTNLRVRPLHKNVRVRSIPSTDGEIIGVVQPTDLLESLETHGRTLAKAGKNELWLRVKHPTGKSGFVAAWLIEAVVRPANRFANVNPVGVNLDALHAHGKPPAHRLGKIGWVRMGYNVSAGRGSTDIRAAYDRYAPLAESYVKAGYKVMFTTSHQTYGEANINKLWRDLTPNDWSNLINTFADMMYNIARQWAGKGLVDVWQVWNEPDGELNAEASVVLRPATYREMLIKVVPRIRAGDSEAIVLTGGLTGTQSGDAYAREVLANLPKDAEPDGIAIHTYGRSPRPNDPFGAYGHIDDVLNAYLSILPNKPVWITEWGVLNAPFYAPNVIGDYAMAKISHVKKKYGSRVPALIWYAWAEGMHNGYGIVDANENVRDGLTTRYLNA
jgi:hypothetical protein